MQNFTYKPLYNFINQKDYLSFLSYSLFYTVSNNIEDLDGKICNEMLYPSIEINLISLGNYNKYFSNFKGKFINKKN